MKQLSTILLCFFSVVLGAQKVIEKDFDYSGQFIALDVKFARTIEVKTWDKNQVYFKASAEIEEERFLEKYDVSFKATNNSIYIEEKADAVFKAMQAYGENQGKEKRRYWYNSGDLCTFNYVLYVPKNAYFKVSSINGDMRSENIEGQFTADLINGDIDIKNYAGKLDLSTINGEIDLKVSNSSFIAETIHGDIYADKDLDLTAYDRHVGQKVKSTVKIHDNQLSLNTINGNMYLRK